MHKKYMLYAIKEAKKAEMLDEVPVGAVIVKNNKIIAKAHNKKIKNNNAIEHAEIIAIKKACKKLNDWRLNDCTIYITLEPCIMCYGAIIESRINTIIYGTENIKYREINQQIIETNNLNIIKHIEKQKTEKLLKEFFKKKRI